MACHNEPMKIGYARVRTDEQHADLQIQALRKAGCKTIYTDKVGGTVRKRPQLERCLNALNPGDVLTVWKLDRLGRSLSHLVGLLEDLKGRGVGFRSLTEAIDTDTPAGRLMGHIIGALAEFERSLIIERTRAGINAAKRRGVRVGRKPKLSVQEVEHARQLIDGGESPSNIARLLGIGRSTIYRALRQGQND